MSVLPNVTDYFREKYIFFKDEFNISAQLDLDQL